jgi:hypothetical protein
MTKFVNVTPLDNYILHITTDDGHIFDFNVLEEIKRIPSYKRLYDLDFFKQVRFKNERIYWDYDHDFHIDQVLARAKKAA